MKNTTKIPFTVSARAARLIGRENVATSQGAITELVKNAYDADAKVCSILLVPSNSAVKEELSAKQFDALVAVAPWVREYYKIKDDIYTLATEIDPEVISKLTDAFKNIPSIWIIDNGHGMSATTIQDQWMVIGTDTKEQIGLSEGGRVMTGAKGIGRFALDRLGQECELFSSKSGSGQTAHWIVDWGDFEGTGKVISDVEAVLEVEDTSLKEVYEGQNISNILPAELPSYGEGPSVPIAYDRGTAICISWLHDQWDERDTRKLRDTLEALLPPRDQSEFSIFIHDFRSPEASGFIDNLPPDQFDYRLKAVVRADGTVSIRLDRQEIDVDAISDTVFGLPAMQQVGFRKEDFEKGSHSYETTLRSLLKNDADEEESYLAIGPLDFTLYFFKLSNPTRDTLTRFPQKSFDVTKRRRWLATSGGVRLYRDDFRVRPYGEPNTQGSDWLLLGQRVASNPAPASRIGWRVPPQQLAGTIHISKEGNPLLADQSNREGIMNERAFSYFRRIILALINEFERDRAYIYSQFDKAYDLDNPEEKDVEEGREIAKDFLRDKPASGSSAHLGTDSQTISDRGRKVAKAYQFEQRKNLALKEDMQVLRGMATLGTVLVSFTHELKQIKANMDARQQRMEASLKRVVDQSLLSAVPDPVNPYNMIARWAREDAKVSRWVDFALSAASPAKRRRRVIRMEDYLKGLSEYWHEFLLSKASTLHLDCRTSAAILAHEIDLDSVFYNLIINSMEAFIRPSSQTSREIFITVISTEKEVEINYKDSGPGLSVALNLPEDIFTFGVSSKSADDVGAPMGTGIGMWLLQNIIHDYGGRVLLDSELGKAGFSLSMTLPLHRVGSVGLSS
ncbi:MULTISPECIES: ATP-binding protein [unclassified Agrobacterium]|uniref:ATP-binding protein n=1 Tax=unclassified Agrobacterium TaxID=2632611 RepID=UPI00037B1645|nr:MULTISPECIES: ATP-binding protein [unclassified Agrobacterium]SNB61980.1 Histidine kinase-, DNA gyrase B-, and HSP90-like ATPase [Agrobacterium sp. 719_389]